MEFDKGIRKDKEFIYGRLGNPSRQCLEKCLADLEDGKYAFCFASGVSALKSLMSLLRAGDPIICGDILYGGSTQLITSITNRAGIESSSVDISDLSSLEATLKPNTKLIFFESPTNPTLKVTDLEKIAKFAKSKNLLTCVDNTFLTSYFQKPLNFGIDIVMHFCTKYMNGHSDVLMGVLITNCEKINKDLALIQGVGGCVPPPFDCFLVTRSLKTLALRMEAHQKNGFAVAKFLGKHPLVEKVIHPGLPSHPQYEITRKQTSGHSGMVGFYIKDATEVHTRKFLKSLKLFLNAGSLGDVNSLAESPFLISRKMLSSEERLRVGITNNYIRLSIGIEPINELIEDLDQSLKATFNKKI